MVDAARHPKVDVRTFTEVERVEGYVGNFKVQLREKSRRVYADRCNGCGECTEVCPIEVPNYFEMDDSGSHARVHKQPASEQEQEQVRDAINGCPVSAIGDVAEE